MPDPPHRPRVLWLIKGLGAGGAERLLVSAAAARDRDFEYEAAYLLPWKDALVPEFESLGVRSTCLDVRNERDLRWARRLRRLLVERRVDVLHVHSPYAAGVARLVARSLPRRTRPGVVSTEHNGWSTFGRPSRVLNALTLPLGDAVVAVSDQVRASVWRPFRGRAQTLVHGVPVESVRAARRHRDGARRELGLDSDQVLIGTVANYNVKKDYPNLLGAVRSLVDRGLPVRVCAVGQGPSEEAILALRSELGLEGTVTVTGYRDDAVRLMAGCDVFVLASRYEGLPVALMEALVLGLPVVATEVGGVPELVTHGVEGLLVPPGRSDLLADAIEKLVRDPGLRRTMADAASARGDSLDITRAVRHLEAIYRGLAAR